MSLPVTPARRDTPRAIVARWFESVEPTRERIVRHARDLQPDELASTDRRPRPSRLERLTVRAA